MAGCARCKMYTCTHHRLYTRPSNTRAHNTGMPTAHVAQRAPGRTHPAINDLRDLSHRIDARFQCSMSTATVIISKEGKASVHGEGRGVHHHGGTVLIDHLDDTVVDDGVQRDGPARGW